MRLDHALVTRGLAATRSRAQDLIRRGAVRVEGQTARKTGAEVDGNTPIEVLENAAYIARSGLKLAAALDCFGLSPAGRTCLDVGASTGGFTEVLLARGAERVYAVDVGRGQLHPSLAGDERVISMEGTDARALRAASFDRPIDAVTCDLSFISLEKVLPSLLPLARPGAWLVALVKPQFEVGRPFVGKGGVVKDEAAKAAAVRRITDCIEGAGWKLYGTHASPVLGQDGNQEILAGAFND
jgi:23S rRNA (cytidine1920-2'-O)/16S rRNA (cytidine1409-2'-O)-methyltransferase